MGGIVIYSEQFLKMKNSDKTELTQAQAAVLFYTLIFAHELIGGPTEEECKQLVKDILLHTSCNDNSTIDDFNNFFKECLLGDLNVREKGWSTKEPFYL